jgi:mRNA interferase RelE/StbE
VPAYRVEWLPSAARNFRRITPEFQRRIAPRVDDLSRNPRPHDTKKLRGSGALYRIRVGDYRVVYEVSDSPAVVTIAHVGHRRDVYRGLQ